MKPSEEHDAAAIRAALARLARYDDESIVHDKIQRLHGVARAALEGRLDVSTLKGLAPLSLGR